MGLYILLCFFTQKWGIIIFWRADILSYKQFCLLPPTSLILLRVWSHWRGIGWYSRTTVNMCRGCRHHCPGAIVKFLRQYIGVPFLNHYVSENISRYAFHKNNLAGFKFLSHSPLSLQTSQILTCYCVGFLSPLEHITTNPNGRTCFLLFWRWEVQNEDVSRPCSLCEGPREQLVLVAFRFWGC